MWPGPALILRPGMDARKPQDGTRPPRPRRPSASLPPVPLQTTDLGGGDLAGVQRRTSAGNLRTAHRPPIAQATIRTVTPEPIDHGAHEGTGAGTGTGTGTGASHISNRGVVSISDSSPRSTPTAPGSVMSNPSASARRQGVVFNDAYPSSPSPTLRPTSVRPRGHTLDNSYRQQTPVAVPADNSRHRVGSVSSTGSIGSMAPHDEVLRGPPLPRHSPVLESTGYTSAYVARLTDLHIQTIGTPKEKKGSTRTRLAKRSSRPSSPLISPPPSVYSLPLPVPTDDANKILLLMKTLCGRMRGEVAYQTETNGPWYSGLCYIEEEKGSLMFDSGENGPFHVAIIPDLRICRVLPVERPGMDRPCLEVVNSQTGAEVLLWPQVAEESELWLAALLCWQQVRPSAVRLGNGPTTPTSQSRPDFTRRGSSTTSNSDTIIKVSRVALWDKGVVYSPRAIVKRASARDLRSSQTGWRKVSCILSDNGELKLITENDNTILCTITLSQLSRCAIQQLDKSVLDEDFCIAIFPIYASTSTQLTIFRPVFISLDHRVLFEVWFVLLRAFTVPEVYALDKENDDQVLEITDVDADLQFEMFRVEKTINLRVIEAKVGGPTSPHNASRDRDRNGKGDQDAFAGNYFAEVVLDGEVRARTITKTETRNPFWRDDCEFADLPANLPFLSVILKRIDGNLEGMAHQLQASLGLSRIGNLTEVSCGSVDIPLQQLDRGKDHEQWLQICDDSQQVIGTMLCKVRHEELVVFMAKDYQTLSEMLHKFSSGLTTQISEALPGQLRRLAEIFLNIFQVSNSAGEWLMALVEDEIDGIGQQSQMKKMRFSRRLRSSESLDVANANEREAIRDMGKSLAGEANLLFRGNSLLTQALEFHMRRLGNEYIEEVLGDKIFEVNEINPNCEVDPGKLQLGEDIGQHWEQLLQFTNEIWDCIASSANKFPPELRHILKYIRAVAEDRYGDFLRTVAFTSVSGFLFLRFICPAILNPKLFGLLRDYPRPRAQRTLTLIAKALQALANLSQIGKKEVWMDPMNRFLTSHRQSLKDFIDEICAIPAERSSCILPASYSTPITILGRLSPLAREGFPSLPYLIDHPRNFASLVRLWMDHNSGRASIESQSDGDLYKFHRCCVSLQERADICMTRIDTVRAADNENASQPTDSDVALADAMEYVSLTNSHNTMSHRSTISSTKRDHERPPGSSGGNSLDGERGYGLRNQRSLDRRVSSMRQQQPQQLAMGTTTTVSSKPSSRHHLGGRPTAKSLRSGKNARKFLSTFLRKVDRTGSPDASSSSSHTGGPQFAATAASGSGSASGGDKSGTTTPTGTVKGRDKEKGRSTFGTSLADAWKDFDSSRH